MDSKCQNINCNKYGSCDENTGNCICNYGYSGSNCEKMPSCDSKIKNDIKNSLDNDIKKFQNNLSNTRLTFGIILLCIAVFIFIFYIFYKIMKIFICGIILFIAGIIFIAYYLKYRNICNCDKGYKCLQKDGKIGFNADSICVPCQL